MIEARILPVSTSRSAKSSVKAFSATRWRKRGRALATLEPVAPAFRLEDISIDGQFLLSRFACLRRVDDRMVMESPLGHARIVIHDRRGAALLALLATPHTAAELAAAMHDFDEATVAAFIALLANAMAASACAENGRIAEDDSVPLRQWEFHDLLFHSRSRLGRHNYPYGGTYRFLDALPPLPALKARRCRRGALRSTSPTCVHSRRMTYHFHA